MEKDPVYAVEAQNGHHESDEPSATYTTGANEAKDIYGDIETAEEYGYVTRGYAMIYYSPSQEPADLV